MKIIINADDFGKNASVNQAITDCFNQNLISNTTIMVNMPYFNEAVKLAKEYNFFHQIGLHLNFYAGEPMTDEMKKNTLFCRDGFLTSDIFLHKSNKFKMFFLNRDTRKCIAKECEAQVQKFLSFGFTERHFDSHGHIHTIPSVWRIVKKVMRKYGFESTRISENVNKNTSFFKKIYKKILNKFVIRGFSKIDFFTSADNVYNGFSINKDGFLEIMVHPDYEKDKLVNRFGIYYYNFPNLSWINKNDLIDYNYLCKGRYNK